MVLLLLLLSIFEALPRGLAQPRAVDFKSPAAVVVSGHARPNGHFIWQTGHCIEVTDLAKFLLGIFFIPGGFLTTIFKNPGPLFYM